MLKILICIAASLTVIIGFIRDYNAATQQESLSLILSRRLSQLRGGSMGYQKRSMKEMQQRKIQIRRDLEDPSSVAQKNEKIMTVSQKDIFRLMNANRQSSVLHSESRTSTGKKMVYYTIFAGRQKTLEVQTPYILKLLDEGLVDEVHLWDLTCKQFYEKKGWFGEGNNDTAYLWDTMINLDKRVYMIKPQDCTWKQYYGFYSSLLRSDDVIIKADDDIVFIDTSRFNGFINTIRSHPSVYLWSANVINNGISAGLHDLDGLIPKGLVSLDVEINKTMTSGCLLFNKTVGRTLHMEFIADPQKYFRPLAGKELRLIQGRISINFVGWLGRNFKQTETYLRMVGNVDFGGGDERAVTEMASTLGQKLIVYMPLVVSHASFGEQGLYKRALRLYRHENSKRLENRVNWTEPAFQIPVKANI